MELQRQYFVGAVEENKDPNRKGRIKVRVQTLYGKGILTEDIPYAFPFAGLAGKDFQVPAIGKLVNILFLTNDLYSPYYIYSENYNTNLKNKLEDLSEDEYVNFVALLFDERTNIFADSEELTIDHLFNKITINNESINHELKDNTQRLNLGAKDAEQDAVLGTNFFEWMDKFITELNDPFSMIGNTGAPILKPELQKLCIEYMTTRSVMLRYNKKGFVSKNVKIIENTEIPKLQRIPKEVEYRKDDITLDGEIDGLSAACKNNKNKLLSTIEIIQKQNEKAKENLDKQNKESCQKGKSSQPSSYIEPDEDMNDWVLPLTGRISSRFGLRPNPTNKTRMQGHNGIDIASPSGTEIVSPGDGKVISNATSHSGGKYIKIRHDNGFVTGYAHLSKWKVKKNDKVKKGDVIGLVGNTGAHTTGPHLHFTVTTPADEKVDPELYFTWPDSDTKNDTKNNNYQGHPYKIDGEECEEGKEVSSDSEPDYNIEGDPLISEPDDEKFSDFVNLIIDNIEGGYFHHNMFDDGRLKDDPKTRKLYRKSGETMFGIDRKNFGKSTTATKNFWKVIDDADAKNKWKWNTKGGKYNKELKELTVKIMKPRFDDWVERYLSDKAKEIIINNDKLFFNFIYATWNGNVRFKDHGKIVDKAIKRGITDPKKLSTILLDARLNSKHSLIVNSGKKVEKIFNSGELG